EVLGAFQGNDGGLHRLIDVSGELSGVLSVYAKVPFFGTYTRDIAKVTLLDFDLSSTTPEPDPVLGEVDAQGVLHLNAGPRAGLRLYRDTADGDEQFTVTAGNQPGQVMVTFQGYTQTFNGVTRIEADGGAGNDTFIIDAAVTVPAELRGGDGDDVL